MPKFRKKPIVIEAEQWFPDRKIEGVIRESDSDAPLNFIDQYGDTRPFRGTDRDVENRVGLIQTLKGFHVVRSGDWVITDVNGEKYPCKPDIFEATYDKVEDH